MMFMTAEGKTVTSGIWYGKRESFLYVWLSNQHQHSLSFNKDLEFPIPCIWFKKDNNRELKSLALPEEFIWD